MATSADIGHGTIYEVWDPSLTTPAFVALAEVLNIEPGEESADLIDATHMASPNNRREFIGGMIDGGEGTVELNYVPGSATDVLLRARHTAQDTQDHRITFPNAVVLTFPGIVRSIGRSIPVDDKMTMTVTVKVAGAPAWA